MIGITTATSTYLLRWRCYRRRSLPQSYVPKLYKKKSFIKLKLSGVKSNRAAIGSRIKITTDDEACPVIYRVISSGSSFGANPLTTSIGLGNATKIIQLELDWHGSGTKQTFTDVAIDSYYEISEDATTLSPMKQSVVPLPEEVSMLEAMKTANQ